MPDYFPPRIRQALEKRKNKEQKSGAARKFMIRNDIYEMLRNSVYVSKGKAICI